MTLAEQISEHVERWKILLRLQDWTIYVQTEETANGDDDDPCKASCDAQPEYQTATLTFTLDRLQTGDDLEEIVVHELTHCLTWPLSNAGDALAKSVGEQEWVRLETERVTTAVSITILEMYRTLKQNGRPKKAREAEGA